MTTTVMLVGPSQIGKDSLIGRLVDEFGCTPHINATTRRPRYGAPPLPPEYIFLSREDVQDQIRKGSFVDWAYYSGEYYGVTGGEPTETRPVMHCGAAMAIRIASRDPSYLPIFLLPQDVRRHEKRILHKFGAELGRGRVLMMMEELDHVPLFDHVVEVGDYASEDGALAQVMSILRGVHEF